MGDPIEITADPIVFKFGEVMVNMQRDPSATPAWFTLLDTAVVYSNPDMRDTLIAALSELTETPEDAKELQNLPLSVGTATLNSYAKRYAQEVTGFPTQPSGPSKKSSGRTPRT